MLGKMFTIVKVVVESLIFDGDMLDGMGRRSPTNR